MRLLSTAHNYIFEEEKTKVGFSKVFYSITEARWNQIGFYPPGPFIMYASESSLSCEDIVLASRRLYSLQMGCFHSANHGADSQVFWSGGFFEGALKIAPIQEKGDKSWNPIITGCELRRLASIFRLELLSSINLWSLRMYHSNIMAFKAKGTTCSRSVFYLCRIL